MQVVKVSIYLFISSVQKFNFKLLDKMYSLMKPNFNLPVFLLASVAGQIVIAMNKKTCLSTIPVHTGH